MSDLLTHVGRLEMVDVDLNLEPQCESPGHSDDSFWLHIHSDGPATHVMRSVCGIGDGLRCARYVVWVGEFGARCPEHGHEGPEQFRFIEL
jgi:hypothetical protein